MSNAQVPSVNDPVGIGHSVADWATSHTWVGKTLAAEASLEVLTLPRGFKPSDTDVIETKDTLQIKSAFGYFEVDAVYDKSKGVLNPISVYLSVPGYGLTTILSKKYIKLQSKDKARKYAVDIEHGTAKSTIEGFISFYLAEAHDQKELIVEYDLNTPFTGDATDKNSLFPTSISTPYAGASLEGDEAEYYKALMKSETEILQLASTGEHELSTFDEDDSNDHQLVLQFMDANVHNIDDGVGPVVALPTWSDDKSLAGGKPYTIDLHFAGILQFSGSVDPSSLTVAAGLYVKVPVAGRVKVASIKGSLLGKGVEASINVVAAKGSVTFYAKSNAQKKHDLCCTLTLKVVLVKSLSLKDVKLWSLPF